MCESFYGKVYIVGDGFCYEGIIISKNNSKYHFIIDCGSQAPKNNAQRVGELSSKKDCDIRLQEVSKEIINHEKHINLFVLTHLHVDHYNGMKTLFNSGIPDVIIMPYLYPEERLFLIINSDIDREESDFLTMPYTTILRLAKEKNPDAKLILIRGNSDSNDEIALDNRDTDESNIWGKPHEDFENIMELEDIKSSDIEVVHASQKSIKILNAVWIFKFFNLEADKNDVDVLKKIVGKLTSKNLYNNISNLKKQYEKIAKNFFNDFNNTSIVTYHAPFQNHYKLGTLITGDINLNHDIADLILKYYKKEIDKIGLFSIPHHGSDKNWNKAFIDNGMLDDSVCFASTHNYYPKRMTSIMMSDLRCHNISMLVVDENRFSEFIHIIKVYEKFYQYHIIRKNNHKLIEIYT